MTTSEAINKLIKVAESQVGYLEKESNKDLDSMTGNAGDENYTKYNRDLKAWTGAGYIAAQWCQAFVDWCFIKAFGVDGAKKLIYMFTNYTPTGSDAFKKHGRYIKRGKGTPKRGDVIYFYSTAKGRIGHVGIVYKVSGGHVYTIEGNTSGASTLVTNGGGVKKKSYKLTSTYIDGYGNVDYAALSGVTTITTEPRILKNGMEGADVKALQQKLIKAGYSCGVWGADGEFGDATEMAVRRFQTQQNLLVDGEAGPQTMAALDKVLAAQKDPEKPQYVEIVHGNCYVREGPSVDYEKRGVALEGTKLIYGGKKADNGWLQVVYKDRLGWVSGKYGKLVSDK